MTFIHLLFPQIFFRATINKQCAIMFVNKFTDCNTKYGLESVKYENKWNHILPSFMLILFKTTVIILFTALL